MSLKGGRDCPGFVAFIRNWVSNDAESSSAAGEPFIPDFFPLRDQDRGTDNGAVLQVPVRPGGIV